MNKERFLIACEQARRGFMTALQVLLSIMIIPAFIVVVFILWIDEIKD